MVKLYAADIAGLPDPKDAHWLVNRLDAERRKRIFQFVKPEDRKRCLGAGLLLGKVLPCYGVSPEEIRTGADGKPSAPGIGFNLSHSGNMVICAVGNGAVGCDVEKITEAPEGVAERFFHPNEIKYLNLCDGRTANENFFRIWTMKESYIKMTGEGMRLPLDRFEVVPEDGKAKVVREGRLLACRITEYSIMDYRAAVCAQEPCSSDVCLMEIISGGNYG